MTQQILKKLFINLTLFTLLACGATFAGAQTTAFTYQGRLSDGTAAANGSYDMQFSVYNAATGGTLESIIITRTAVQVTNGIFTAQLNFGTTPNPFDTGRDRYLEISVKPTGGGTYTTLAPRQQITSVPFANRAINATNATNFNGSLSGDVSGTQSATVVSSVGGQSAANVGIAVQSINTATSESTPNTLVKRDANGDLSGNVINANTQYNIGGNAALRIPGGRSVFVGSGGSGSSNSFLGFGAGGDTTGSGNSFLGYLAGSNNTTGTNNTAIGNGANVASNNLENATAIGAGAAASSSNTVVLGRSSGADGVQIPGSLRVGGGAVVERILTVSASLNFPALGSNQNATLTISMPGALVGDSVILGLPSNPTVDFLFTAFVSAADTVTVRARNLNQSSAIDPSSNQFRVIVIGVRAF